MFRNIRLRSDVECGANKAALADVTLHRHTGLDHRRVAGDIDNNRLALGVVAPPVAAISDEQNHMVVTERVHLLACCRHRQHTANDRVALVLEIDHLQTT